MKTEWLVERVDGWPGQVNLRLTVDTTGPIVELIEQAAQRAGIQLERVEQDEQTFLLEAET